LIIIRDYSEENAMKNDIDFEKLILDICGTEAMLLKAIYCNSKFKTARHELTSDKKVKDAAISFFTNNALLPLSKILHFERRTMIASINATLPFWYSISFVVAIIRVFKGKR
jgi:uncharacterized membrane protein